MQTLFEPKILSIMPTWQCTASCRDCGTFSSPKVKVKLERETIKRTIEVAAAEGFALVVFTGGEATLRWNDLLEGIALARSFNLKTRLVTNGWWGTKPANAKMQALRAVGLNEINFSTGDEHARFVPIEAVCSAIAASIMAGYEPLVMIEVRANAKITKQTFSEEPAFTTMLGSEASRVTFVESPWMPTDFETIAEYPTGYLVNRNNVAAKSGCDSIFSTHTLQANRRVGLCCGLGMSRIEGLQSPAIGDDVSFHDIAAAAESDITKLLIKVFGPERLLSNLATLNPAISWENMYAHKCHACMRVFADPQIAQTIAAFEDRLWAEIASTMAVDQILAALKPVQLAPVADCDLKS